MAVSFKSKDEKDMMDLQFLYPMAKILVFSQFLNPDCVSVKHSAIMFEGA